MRGERRGEAQSTNFPRGQATEQIRHLEIASYLHTYIPRSNVKSTPILWPRNEQNPCRFENLRFARLCAPNRPNTYNRVQNDKSQVQLGMRGVETLQR